MGMMASQMNSLTIVYSTFIQAQIKENTKAPRHRPLCGEFTGAGEFPAQKASDAENVSLWWRHQLKWGSGRCFIKVLTVKISPFTEYSIFLLKACNFPSSKTKHLWTYECHIQYDGKFNDSLTFGRFNISKGCFNGIRRVTFVGIITHWNLKMFSLYETHFLQTAPCTVEWTHLLTFEHNFVKTCIDICMPLIISSVDELWLKMC